MKRKKANFTLPLDLIEQLKEASESSFIPQARIVELALVRFFEELKYDKESYRSK